MAKMIRASVRARPAEAKALEAASVRITYPVDGEIVGSSGYTFQVGASPGASAVELSVDQGDWQACRESLGLWWLDWAGYDAGEHEVVARIRLDKGETRLSQTRRFSVRRE